MDRNGHHEIIVAVGVVVIGICSAGWGRTIYVDAAAGENGDGSSWPKACRSLQDALAKAAEAARPVEIRVAQGVYKPDRGAGRTTGDRAATFELLNGVTLLGGYAGGTGLDPNARDIRLNETVLSGDLKNDDVAIKDPNAFRWSWSEPTRMENSLHVVTARGTDETAVLDGFVISGGCTFTPAALTGDELGYGGGMFNDGASPTVRRCLFRDNISSWSGGGVYSAGGKPAFSGCVFQRNFAFQAGAMCSSNSHLTVADCIFTENTGGGGGGGAVMNSRSTAASLKRCAFNDNAASMGGAIYSYSTETVDVEDCTFEGNRATSFEGGGALAGAANLVLTRCTFRRNAAHYNGGALCAQGGVLRVSDCTFSNNTAGGEADGGGGALSVDWRAGIIDIADSTFENNVAPQGGALHSFWTYARITGCRFRNNTASRPATQSFWSGGGGAVRARYSALKFTGCEFQGNRSANWGGAIESDQTKGLALVNCVLAGNRAERAGGIHADRGDRRLEHCTLASNFDAQGFALAGSAVLEHCIAWGGSALAPSGYNLSTTYCDIQGGYPGHGNIDMDPLFVRPGRWADAQDANVTAGPDDPNAVWVAGDYHLQSQAGHWDAESTSWACDGLTSPCIDAGDFDRPTGAELFPNGGIVNLGAYGGTAEASKSYFGAPACENEMPGDLNGDCQVDITDAVLASQPWRQAPIPPASQPPAIVITAPADGAVIEVSPANPTILIVADASDPDGSVREVYFSVAQRTGDGSRTSATADDEPADGWHWHWKFLDPAAPYAAGQYTIAAHAIDDDCEIGFAPEVHITVVVTK